ncbi:MAG: 50S ribosomal protein L29 [Verrucomicrobia bacterium]|nr:50S ribosomal protein L29 [Verrucomicrobiota bacterium]
MPNDRKDKPSAASALRPLVAAELQKRVREAREELLSLRLKKATGAVENPARFRTLRREVARCLTVLGQADKK